LGIFLNKSAGKCHWKSPENHSWRTGFSHRFNGSRVVTVLGHGSTGLGRKTPWQVGNRLLAIIHGGSDLRMVRVWLTGPRTARVLPSLVKRVAGHGTWAPPKIVGFGSAGDDPAPPTSNRNSEGSDFSPAPSGLPTRIHRIRSSLPLPSLISLSTSLDLSLSRHSLCFSPPSVSPTLSVARVEEERTKKKRRTEKEK
jgi:hypothetical protein